jgi:hypothetical protein
MRSYLTIQRLDPGWQEEMERWGMTIALVPADSRVAAALIESGDWARRYGDETSVLLERLTAPTVAAVEAAVPDQEHPRP